MNAGHAKSAADSLHVGFVVLARRPNPEHQLTAANCKKAAGYPISTGIVCKACAGAPYIYEPVSAVFPEYPKGLEQAQNVRKSCEDSPFEFCRNGRVLSGNPDPVEYVIGEINLLSEARCSIRKITPLDQ